MLRVLHVIGAMGSGGAEAMLMNLYRNIDRSKLQFDFVVHTNEICFYDEEIQKLGGKIYRTEKFNCINYYTYKKWWKGFYREHREYQIVHGHIGSSASVYLYEAKKRGLITIAHSHNTKNKIFSIKNSIWNIASYPTRYIAEYFFACSMEAGIDRFGKKFVLSEKYQILKNAIDVRKFLFSERKREDIRKVFNLENTFVIGHVGRFSLQKNHEFLVEVFSAIYSRDNNARLLLIGEGELEKNIRRLCEKKGVSTAVIFAGVHQNVEDYYAAMDVFCFPSIYEGLGISLVEAQANGLPCIVSENIQKEADIGANLVKKLDLRDSVDYWADVMLNFKDWKREDTEKYIIQAGYDVKTTSYQLEKFYLNLFNK